MFHRPLIPMLLSFGGGILAGHQTFSLLQRGLFPLYISLVLFLLGAVFFSSRLRILCLLFSFFLTGTLIDSRTHPPSRLLAFAALRDKVTIEGTVLETIRVTRETARLRVKAKRLFTTGKILPVNEDIIVTIYKHPPDLRPGERIRFPARLKPFRNFKNPGGYDYKSAMKNKGLTCAASVSDGRYIVSMGLGDLSFQTKFLKKIQQSIRDFFRTKLNDQNFAVYCALILGQRQTLTSELREPFNRTGLGHVLAVSGLHVGLVAWTAFFLIKWVLSLSYRLALKTNIQRLAAVLTCFPVVGYTLLTGFQIPGQRAMIMVLTFLGSLILGKEREVWSTLSLAGLLILALDPHALFSISFQFSFLAVTGILLLTPLFLRRLPSPETSQKGKTWLFNNALVYLVGLIAVSLSATLFLLPVTSLYFHRISLVAVPANVTVIPILGVCVLPLGLLSVAALPFSHQVAGFFLKLGEWGLDLIMEITRFWASLSWASFWVVSPNSVEIILFYMFIFFAIFFARSKWARMGLAVTLIFVLVDLGYWFYKTNLHQDLRVTFLDVRNGNAALVEFPGGEKMLIDGGGFSDATFDVGKMVVAPYLWQSKIRKIDYLVLSHPQSDHMNGLRFVAEAFGPKEFWWNGDKVKTASFEELMDILKTKGVKKLLPADLTAGKRIHGVKIRVLHPKPDSYSSDRYDARARLNNNSLVLKISFRGTTFLFPGDLQRQGEAVLISNASDALKSDVLLSPHHGSKTSNSPEFLEAVSPSICVISSGGENLPRSSQKQTIRRLTELGCKVFFTGRTGAVQITVGTDKLKVNTFLKDKKPELLGALTYFSGIA